jgi:hypothetical protein
MIAALQQLLRDDAGFQDTAPAPNSSQKLGVAAQAALQNMQHFRQGCLASKQGSCNETASRNTGKLLAKCSHFGNSSLL